MDKIEYEKKMNVVRSDIDRIDSQIIPLLIERMECSERVAKIKDEAKMPVFDPVREQAILGKIAQMHPDYGDSLAVIYNEIMAVSKARQSQMLAVGSDIRALEKNAARVMEISKAKVACQGVAGAYSHIASKLFFGKNASVTFMGRWDDVFTAIESGEADYGVLPVENSDAGSVTDVYALLMKHRFYIVGCEAIAVKHCLAAKSSSSKPAKVISHNQALMQCSDYIMANNLESKSSENTAVAAKYVSESKENTIAAICSEEAAKEFELTILDREIQNASQNKTRFIIIAKKAILPDDANKISLCFSLPHEAGTLHGILERFAVNGLSLTKIESRPIPNGNFEYDFYLDFTGNIHEKNTLELICALSDQLPRFSFLGNYKEK